MDAQFFLRPFSEAPVYHFLNLSTIKTRALQTCQCFRDFPLARSCLRFDPLMSHRRIRICWRRQEVELHPTYWAHLHLREGNGVRLRSAKWVQCIFPWPLKAFISKSLCGASSCMYSRQSWSLQLLQDSQSTDSSLFMGLRPNASATCYQVTSLNENAAKKLIKRHPFRCISYTRDHVSSS